MTVYSLLSFVELYNRFKLLDFETTNSSITVRWEWGVYADPNVRIKLTAYIDFETPWKNPVTLRAVSDTTIEYYELRKKRVCYIR